MEGPLRNIRVANDIDPMGASNDEPQNLTNRLVDTTMAFGMEVNTDKSKIMTNSMNTISAGISMNSQKSDK